MPGFDSVPVVSMYWNAPKFYGRWVILGSKRILLSLSQNCWEVYWIFLYSQQTAPFGIGILKHTCCRALYLIVCVNNFGKGSQNRRDKFKGGNKLIHPRHCWRKWLPNGKALHLSVVLEGKKPFIWKCITFTCFTIFLKRLLPSYNVLHSLDKCITLV